MIFQEINSKFKTSLPEGLLENAAGQALLHQSRKDADLTLVITGDREIRSLNRNFLGVDAPTDAISFPADDELDPDSGRHYLGDVVISLPRAEVQARERGHDLQVEVQLLVVHGILHLCGHDHAEPDEKLHMWKAQEEILTQLGLSPSIVHE